MPSSRAFGPRRRAAGTSSSPTWSRTSESSSTSDGTVARLTGPARLAGLVRLTHPFPSTLDGFVVAAVATVAGADPWTAVRVGLSMTALQASIGALNDLVDATSDRGRKPGKPIPAGLVSRRLAWATVMTGAGLGLGLALPGGGGLVALALLVLAVGYGYDLLAKGTAWSWVPFAIGIPLLPVYGWYGAVSDLPSWFAALLPMAVLAGAALAVSNAHADLERDRDAGTTTVATALGPERSWWATLGLWSVTAAIAIGSAATVATPPKGLGLAATVAGVSIILAGTAIGRAAGPRRREWAWELQAVGAAVTAIGWIIAVA